MTNQIPASAVVEFNGAICGTFGDQDADFKAQFDGVEPEIVSTQEDYFDEVTGQMRVRDVKMLSVMFLGDDQVSIVGVTQDMVQANIEDRLHIYWKA